MGGGSAEPPVSAGVPPIHNFSEFKLGQYRLLPISLRLRRLTSRLRIVPSFKRAPALGVRCCFDHWPSWRWRVFAGHCPPPLTFRLASRSQSRAKHLRLQTCSTSTTIASSPAMTILSTSSPPSGTSAIDRFLLPDAHELFRFTLTRTQAATMQWGHTDQADIEAIPGFLMSDWAHQAIAAQNAKIDAKPPQTAEDITLDKQTLVGRGPRKGLRGLRRKRASLLPLQ